MVKERNVWTKEEDDLLRKNVDIYGAKHWKFVAMAFDNRLPAQCAHRWNKVLNPTIKKGMWTTEEDSILMKAIRKYGGPGRWSMMSEHVPGRNGKQCRERYYNHLSPRVNKTAWAEEEDETVLSLQRRLGCKWAEISRHLNGRTENSIKNRWNAKLQHLAASRADNADTEVGSLQTCEQATRSNSSSERKRKSSTRQQATERSEKRARSPSSTATTIMASPPSDKSDVEKSLASKRPKFDLASSLGLLLRCDAALSEKKKKKKNKTSTERQQQPACELSPASSPLLLATGKLPSSTLTPNNKLQGGIPPIKPFLLQYNKYAALSAKLLPPTLWPGIFNTIPQLPASPCLMPIASRLLPCPPTSIPHTPGGGANKLEWFATLAASMPTGTLQPSPAHLSALSPQAKTKWEAPRTV